VREAVTATKEDFLSAITEHGLFPAIASYFSKLGCGAEVKAIEEFNHDGKINLVQLILSVPKAYQETAPVLKMIEQLRDGKLDMCRDAQWTVPIG
jgi:hypothetical protein